MSSHFKHNNFDSMVHELIPNLGAFKVRQVHLAPLLEP